MVSRIFKGAATLVATLSLASVASAGCGTGLYCGDASAQPISSWTGQSAPSMFTGPAKALSWDVTML